MIIVIENYFLGRGYSKLNYRDKEIENNLYNLRKEVESRRDKVMKNSEEKRYYRKIAQGIDSILRKLNDYGDIEVGSNSDPERNNYERKI